MSSLIPYVDRHIANHCCGFWCNRSTAVIRYLRKNGSTVRQCIGCL